jgi:oligoendopeptidase F
MTIDIPKRPKRKFLPEDFTITTFDALKPFLDQLLKAEINSATDLHQWLKSRSELESIISEDMGWRYIRMTCHTDKEEYQKSYQDFVQNIQPHLAPVADQLNKKALSSPYLKELEP